MNRDETIVRLCALVTRVGREKFAHKFPHDCFCKESDAPFVSVDEKIITFIESSVEEKLKNK